MSSSKKGKKTVLETVFWCWWRGSGFWKYNL